MELVEARRRLVLLSERARNARADEIRAALWCLAAGALRAEPRAACLVAEPSDQHDGMTVVALHPVRRDHDELLDRLDDFAAHLGWDAETIWRPFALTRAQCAAMDLRYARRGYIVFDLHRITAGAVSSEFRTSV